MHDKTTLPLRQRCARTVANDHRPIGQPGGDKLLHQFLAAAPDMAGEPAPEFELADDPHQSSASRTV
jgi:hypothetical protein